MSEHGPLVRRVFEFKPQKKHPHEKDQNHRTYLAGRRDPGPGGPNEDGDYSHGGWAVPHRDPAVGEAIVAAHGKAFDLLLGRRTYDILGGYWPKAEKSPMADSLNAATKYVATHRPDSLGWGPVEGLGPDIVEGVRRIKAKDGPDLIVWGSSTLTPVLLEHGLADEVLLLVFPVLLGTGKRFFSDGAPPRELALVGTKAASSGVIISTYRPSRAFADRLLRRCGGVMRFSSQTSFLRPIACWSKNDNSNCRRNLKNYRALASFLANYSHGLRQLKGGASTHPCVEVGNPL